MEVNGGCVFLHLSTYSTAGNVLGEVMYPRPGQIGGRTGGQADAPTSSSSNTAVAAEEGRNKKSSSKVGRETEEALRRARQHTVAERSRGVGE